MDADFIYVSSSGGGSDIHSVRPDVVARARARLACGGCAPEVLAAAIMAETMDALAASRRVRVLPRALRDGAPYTRV